MAMLGDMPCAFNFFSCFLPNFTLLLLFMVCVFSCVQESRAGVQAEEGKSILSVQTVQSSARVSHTYTMGKGSEALCNRRMSLLACLLACFLPYLFVFNSSLSLSFPLFFFLSVFFSLIYLT